MAIIHSAFFYGTLMHPRILKQVIGNAGLHLQICPSVLLEHTRHKVKDADYPGVVPYERSRAFYDDELGHEERSVRGTLVIGLTEGDMVLLDVFEGSEYERIEVQCHPLGDAISLASYSVEENALVPPTPAPLPPLFELRDPVKAETYIYCELTSLEPNAWSFGEFVRENAWKWYGAGAEEYTEIDRRRATGNTTIQIPDQ